MTLLGTLPTLDTDAASRALSASTSIRASAQAMRREIAEGRSEAARELVGAGSVRAIDRLARQSLTDAISRIPNRPQLALRKSDTAVRGLCEVSARTGVARKLVACHALDPAGARAFCEGSVRPLVGAAENALAAFNRAVERESKKVSALSSFEFEPDTALTLAQTGVDEPMEMDCGLPESEFPFILQVPEGVYAVIGSEWFMGEDSSINHDALRALLWVGHLVTPDYYMSPIDLLEGMIGDGFSFMLEEILDALRFGVDRYGLEPFFEILESTPPEQLDPELEAACWMPEFILRELAELNFRTTDFAAYLRGVLDEGRPTIAKAQSAVDRAPKELRDRLQSVLRLLQIAEQVAPKPGGAYGAGALGGFCGLPIYGELFDHFVNESIHMPLMEGCERCCVGVSGNVPESIRYHTIELATFMAFNHLVAHVELL